MAEVRAAALDAGSSLWSGAGNCLRDRRLASRAERAVGSFLRLVDALAHDTKDLVLHDQVDQVIQTSGLLAHHGRAGNEKAEARVENLVELVDSARGPMRDEDSGLSPLDEFLSHAVLESGEAQASADEDAVQLMTLHSAKGMEFPLVFVCGLEEGLFPHSRSIDDIGGLEEERRLCYVGLTRAQRKLYLTHAEQRRLHGKYRFTIPSRFIGELPRNLLRELGQRMSVSRPVYRGERHARRLGEPYGRTSGQRLADPSGEDDAPMKLGRHVRHPKFGEGVVIALGRQRRARARQVNFQTAGTKWLVIAYAKLELM